MNIEMETAVPCTESPSEKAAIAEDVGIMMQKTPLETSVSEDMTIHVDCTDDMKPTPLETSVSEDMTIHVDCTDDMKPVGEEETDNDEDVIPSSQTQPPLMKKKLKAVQAKKSKQPKADENVQSEDLDLSNNPNLKQVEKAKAPPMSVKVYTDVEWEEIFTAVISGSGCEVENIGTESKFEMIEEDVTEKDINKKDDFDAVLDVEMEEELKSNADTEEKATTGTNDMVCGIAEEKVADDRNTGSADIDDQAIDDGDKVSANNDNDKDETVSNGREAVDDDVGIDAEDDMDVDEEGMEEELRATILQQSNESTPAGSDEEHNSQETPAVVKKKAKKFKSGKKNVMSPRQLEFTDEMKGQANEAVKESNQRTVSTEIKNKGRAKTKHVMKISKKQKMEERVLEEKGTWIQCVNTFCLRWRYLPTIHDPTQLPEKWVCEMNQDPEYNSCDVAEQEWDEDHINTDFVYSEYAEGSVVWAKMNGYPWWPGMVEIDPDYESFCEIDDSQHSRIPSHYHVVFFDDKVSRAWVRAAHVKRFTGDDAQDDVGIAKTKGHDYRKEVAAAKTKAVRALTMPLKERLKEFSFAKRFTGRWGIESQDSVEDEPEVTKKKSEKKKKSRSREGKSKAKHKKDRSKSHSNAKESRNSHLKPVMHADLALHLDDHSVDEILDNAEAILENVEDELYEFMSQEDSEFEPETIVHVPDTKKKKKSKCSKDKDTVSKEKGKKKNKKLGAPDNECVQSKKEKKKKREKKTVTASELSSDEAKLKTKKGEMLIVGSDLPKQNTKKKAKPQVDTTGVPLNKTKPTFKAPKPKKIKEKKVDTPNSGAVKEGTACKEIELDPDVFTQETSNIQDVCAARKDFAADHDNIESQGSVLGDSEKENKDPDMVGEGETENRSLAKGEMTSSECDYVKDVKDNEGKEKKVKKRKNANKILKQSTTCESGHKEKKDGKEKKVKKQRKKEINETETNGNEKKMDNSSNETANTKQSENHMNTVPVKKKKSKFVAPTTKSKTSDIGMEQTDISLTAPENPAPVVPKKLKKRKADENLDEETVAKKPGLEPECKSEEVSEPNENGTVEKLNSLKDPILTDAKLSDALDSDHFMCSSPDRVVPINSGVVENVTELTGYDSDPFEMED